MPTIDICGLLAPYLLSPIGDEIHEKLQTYLDLLIKWNSRTNLTSIREPERMVQRHFGESLLLGQILTPFQTLLDFGSGAGFPGIPIQLLYPGSKVVLAESQGKKASFLREAVRTLGLPAEVWSQRVEAMPPDRRFDVVAMRAVDSMDMAITAAEPRVAEGGSLALLLGREAAPPAQWNWTVRREIPGGGAALLGTR